MKCDNTRLPTAAQIREELTCIWKMALDLRDIGPDDDFFAFGGDSLDAMQISMLVAERLDIELPSGAVFQHPTIARMVEAIVQRRAETAAEAASARTQKAA